MIDVTIFVAFTAGVISFLAPCVLPIVPGFLAFLSGARPGEEATRKQIFFGAVFFVLGFSVVFAVLGVLLNTVLESIAYDVQIWLSRIGGAIIIFFGLFLMGLIHIRWLEGTYRFKVSRLQSRYLTAFLFGAAFAAGWTPCVGAALGAILGLAASQPGIAFWLLLSYALGLGLPFLIIGAFAAQARSWIQKINPIIPWVNRIFGLVLIALGILIFTNRLSLIANFDLLNSFLLR